MTQIDVDAVSDMVREVATITIAPRFRQLATHDVEEKTPGEVVTIADREAEAMITTRLRGMLPGVPVVGEEAVALDATLLEAIRAEPMVWLVDPLDGTANFASGDPHWAVMVALVRAGEAVASWIYRHSDSGLYVAERGGGAWRDGRRLTCPAERSRPETLRGAVLQRFLTEAERTRIVPRLDRFERVTAGYTCSGFEYPAIVEGRQEFALFQRLLPWDHAPGVLLLTEAGGVARRPDGTPFTLDHTSRGLLLASSPVVWETVRDALYGA